jgi:hypothetical protein
MIYTDKEATVQTHTVKDAIASAKFILKERKNITHVELFHLKLNKLQDSDKITMQKLNELSDSLIRDSIAYNNGVRFT